MSPPDPNDLVPSWLRGLGDGAVSAVLTQAADLLLTVDRHGCIAKVTLGPGLAGKEALVAQPGQRWVDAVAPQSRATAEQVLREAFERGASSGHEVVQRLGAEGELPLRLAAFRLADGRVMVAGRELRTEARMRLEVARVEQAGEQSLSRVAQADAKYRVLFQTAQEGVLVVNLSSGQVINANPAAARLWQQPQAALVRRALVDLFEPGDRRALEGLLAAAEAGGRSTGARVRVPGTVAEVTVEVAPLRVADGRLALVRASPAQPAAEPSRSSRLVAMLEALAEGFVVCGDEGEVLSANGAFGELVGQPLPVGQPLDTWLGARPEDFRALWAVLREHELVRDYPMTVRRAAGPPVEVLVSAARAEGPALVGLLLHPVTALVGAEPAHDTLAQLRGLVGRTPMKDIVRESADSIEKLCIRVALERAGNNRAVAARVLGLSRQALYGKLRLHGLEADDGSS